MASKSVWLLVLVVLGIVARWKSEGKSAPKREGTAASEGKIDENKEKEGEEVAQDEAVNSTDKENMENIEAVADNADENKMNGEKADENKVNEVAMEPQVVKPLSCSLPVVTIGGMTSVVAPPMTMESGTVLSMPCCAAEALYSGTYTIRCTEGVITVDKETCVSSSPAGRTTTTPQVATVVQYLYVEKEVNYILEALKYLAIALCPVLLRELQPRIQRYSNAWIEEFKSQQRKKRRLDIMWQQINPNSVAELPEQDFKQKAKDLPLFKYLIADGLSMDWLFKKIDTDKDQRIIKQEFHLWYDRLSKFRPDADEFAAERGANRLYTVFVGRARTGKSTLLNSTLGYTKFSSGMTPNEAFAGGRTGITADLEMEVRKGCPRSFYVNLPGFLKLEEARALQMVHTKALTPRDGYVKLVFVVTPEAGSISPETHEVLKQTLLTSDLLQHYAIIVNQCSPKFLKDMENEAERERWIRNHLTEATQDMDRPPPAVFFFPQQPHAVDYDNVLLHVTEEFKEFLFNVHCNNMRECTTIDEQSIKIEIEKLEERKQKMRDDAEKKRKADAALANSVERQRAEEEEQKRKRQKTAERGWFAKLFGGS